MTLWLQVNYFIKFILSFASAIFWLYLFYSMHSIIDISDECRIWFV